MWSRYACRRDQKKREKRKRKKKKERLNAPIENGNESLSCSSELPGIDSNSYCSDQVCTRRKESRVSLWFQFAFLSFRFRSSSGSNQGESEALFFFFSFFFSTTHPLLIFKYFGDQAVRSIAEETLFRTILTQTWAYAQVAEAKNLTKTRLASHHHHHHRKEAVENMIGLTLQLESVGCCYWRGEKVSAIRSPDGYKEKGCLLCRQVNVLILLNRSEE